jgi:hypothetical protein
LRPDWPDVQVETDGGKAGQKHPERAKKLGLPKPMSKKACLGANLPQSFNNLQETGIFRLLIETGFVL